MTSDDVADILAQYERSLVNLNRADSTIKRRLYDVRRFLDSRNGDLASVRGGEINDWLGRADWEPQTRYSFGDSLRSFFAWAADQGHIPSDPAAGLPVIRLPRIEAEPASREAIRKGLATAPERERMMIKLAFVLGLKPSEIAVAHPRDLKVDEHGVTRLKARSGARKIREVRVPLSLAEEFRAYNGGQGFSGRIQGRISSPYVTRRIAAAMPDGETPEQIRLAYRSMLEDAAVAEGWQLVAPYHATQNLLVAADPGMRESEALRAHVDRIERGLANDPAAAISSCKNLLETLFKLVLADRGVTLKDNSLPGQYRAVSEALDIRSSIPESEKGSAAIDSLLDALSEAVLNVGRIRNEAGTGHGGEHVVTADPRLARLAFNATVTISEFVLETWRRDA